VDGGEPRRLTLPPPTGFDSAPAFSLDGRRLAYATCVTLLSPYPCDVHVVDLDPDFVPTGAARRLTRQVYTVIRIAWAADGQSLVYETELGPGVFYLWRVGITGRESPERLEIEGMGARFPAILGNRLVFTRSCFDIDIYRFEPGRPRQAFPASSSFWDGSSQFSHDGRRIAFESLRSGERMEIWLAGADGSDPQQLTHGPGRWQGSPTWSPDGQRIAFDSWSDDGHWDIWTIDVAGGAPRRLTVDPGDENVPLWFRDGLWIYYGAKREGSTGIWRIRIADGREERIATLGTPTGGYRESLDGQALFFKSAGRLPLFRRSLAGGSEAKVVDCALGFDVVAGGIYYGGCDPGRDAQLHRFDMGTGRDEVLGILEKYQGGLTVSPDGGTILFAGEARTGSDLMLVEGFR